MYMYLVYNYHLKYFTTIIFFQTDDKILKKHIVYNTKILKQYLLKFFED